MLKTLFTTIHRHHARVRAVAALKGMTDRQLSDLGIHRSQIRAYMDARR